MVIAVVAVLAVVLVVTAVALPFSLYRQIGDANVDLDSLPDRPSPTDIAPGTLNVAVLGTEQGHCVSAMVFHIAASRLDASFVSIPGTGVCGAHASPMTPESARSVAANVEQHSGVRLNHLAILDWATVAELDAMAGGVQVDLSSLPEYATAAYPTVHQDQVLDFVSSPIANERDEVVRIERQQVLLREVLRATLHQEMRKNPIEVYAFLDVVTRGLALDADWSFADASRLAVSLRNMRSNDIGFHTAPASDGTTSTANDPLWVAVRQGRLDGR